MQGIGHIHAVPRIGLHREVDNISGLRVNPHEMQDMGQRHADPLGYVGPAFFTDEFGNVTARWVALQLAHRKRRRLGDHAIDGEPPLRETSGLKTLKVFAKGRELVGKWTLAKSGCAGIRVPTNDASAAAAKQRSGSRRGHRCRHDRGAPIHISAQDAPPLPKPETPAVAASPVKISFRRERSIMCAPCVQRCGP